MFILIPTAIIFLCFAYLQLNDNVSIYIQVFLYFIMILTSTVSFKLYKKVKGDMKLQEINSIDLEIHQIHKKLKDEKDESRIVYFNNKIKALEKEKENYS